MLVAASLLLLFGVASIAVDLSAMRLDRALDQRVADTAATAGAFELAKGDGQLGCETALAYVALNIPGLPPLDHSGCAAFEGTCSHDAPEEITVTAGRFTIRVVHPVADDHDLMDPAQLGAPAQPASSEDGLGCQRLGVQVSAEHSGLFARVLGFTAGTTTVHAVAAASIPENEGVPLNLLVLDRFGCQAIHVQGNGGVIVDSVLNPNGGGPGVATLEAGVAAADSDGSAGCSSDGVIDVDGDNAVLRADGPAGCGEQIGTEVKEGWTRVMAAAWCRRSPRGHPDALATARTCPPALRGLGGQTHRYRWPRPSLNASREPPSTTATTAGATTAPWIPPWPGRRIP